MRRGFIRSMLVGLCAVLGAHGASSQTITGAPPISAPVLPTDQIFIFRGQTPVNSVQIGNLTTGLADCHTVLAKGLVPTPPNNGSLFLNGQCNWASLGATTVVSLSNVDGSLTIAPPTGAVVASCTTATTSQKGCVRPDGTTITITAGVIQAVGAVASQITVGTTTIGSGAPGSLLYDNAGVLGNETLASLLSSPPAIGGGVPSSGTFSSLSATGNVLFGGSLTASSLSTSGVIGGSICATSGGMFLYESGINCYASPTGANPTATAGAAAINGSSANFMRADAAPAIAIATNSVFGIVEGDGSTLSIGGGVISCTTATTSQIGCSKPDGTILTISAGLETVAKATNAAFGVAEGDGTTISAAAGIISCMTATGAQKGCARPDGTTITVSGGVLTAIGAAAGSISVGITTIGSGTPGDLLYDNAGVLGNETFAAACTNATSAAFGCVKTDGSTITASAGVVSVQRGAEPGFVNRLRGSTLSQWYGGTSITVGTGLTWTAEGVGCLETGATVTASQVVNTLTNPNSYYTLKIQGNTSNTDVTCRFVLASDDAAMLAGQRATFQLPILNKTGGSITATISSAYPTAKDGNVTGGGAWTGGTNPDLTTKNLQACSNNATCVLSYTFDVNSGANNGYEVVIDFGALGNTAFLDIGGAFDFRVTTGISTGQNNSPPTPEVYTVDRDQVWCSKFYQTSYANGQAPGTATRIGMVGATFNSATVGAAYTAIFPVPMRATPTLAYYDGAGALSTYSGILNNGTTTFADGLAVATAPFNIGPKSFIVGYGSNVNYNIYMHYTADARINGG